MYERSFGAPLKRHSEKPWCSLSFYVKKRQVWMDTQRHNWLLMDKIKISGTQFEEKISTCSCKNLKIPFLLYYVKQFENKGLVEINIS